jgi:hypothetical protein
MLEIANAVLSDLTRKFAAALSGPAGAAKRYTARLIQQQRLDGPPFDIAQTESRHLHLLLASESLTAN